MGECWTFLAKQLQYDNIPTWTLQVSILEDFKHFHLFKCTSNPHLAATTWARGSLLRERGAAPKARCNGAASVLPNQELFGVIWMDLNLLNLLLDVLN